MTGEVIWGDPPFSYCRLDVFMVHSWMSINESMPQVYSSCEEDASLCESMAPPRKNPLPPSVLSLLEAAGIGADVPEHQRLRRLAEAMGVKVRTVRNWVERGVSQAAMSDAALRFGKSDEWAAKSAGYETVAEYIADLQNPETNALGFDSPGRDGHLSGHVIAEQPAAYKVPGAAVRLHLFDALTALAARCDDAHLALLISVAEAFQKATAEAARVAPRSTQPKDRHEPAE